MHNQYNNLNSTRRNPHSVNVECLHAEIQRDKMLNLTKAYYQGRSELGASFAVCMILVAVDSELTSTDNCHTNYVIPVVFLAL